jgi:hypothetical protein
MSAKRNLECLEVFLFFSLTTPIVIALLRNSAKTNNSPWRRPQARFFVWWTITGPVQSSEKSKLQKFSNIHNNKNIICSREDQPCSRYHEQDIRLSGLSVFQAISDPPSPTNSERITCSQSKNKNPDSSSCNLRSFRQSAVREHCDN